jgi:beta-lactam-binding protein with PASTA domain
MTFFQFLFSRAVLKQLVFSLLATIALVFLIMWWLRFSTNHGQQIEVPDLSKMDLETVEETLDELDLDFAIIDSVNYNPDYPKFSVIEQLPKPGSFVKEDRKIYLYLNPSDYRLVAIPEVVGRTQRQAEPTLMALGFTIGQISYRPYIAKGEVLELRHEGSLVKPGDKLPKTATIDLVLGDGEGNLNRNAGTGTKRDGDGG